MLLSRLCKGRPSPLALWWLPWHLNSLSNCSLIYQLAKQVASVTVHLHVYMVLNNMHGTGEVQYTKEQFKAYVLSISTSVCMRQPSLRLSCT